VPESRSQLAPKRSLSLAILITYFDLLQRRAIIPPSTRVLHYDCLWDPISSLASIGGLRIVPESREQLGATKDLYH
jgi:hypothetical protein